MKKISKINLKKMGELCEDDDASAAKDLLHYPPQSWCRAYFDTQCKNIMVDNNFTESFNEWILEARHMPIIKMLEEIRIKVMNLLAINEDKIRKWNGDFSPSALMLYNDYMAICHYCKVEFNGDFRYEITEGDDRHIVDLEHKKCTCRLWQLFGIPCPHAIKATIYDRGDPKLQIHWYYSKEAYSLTYKHKFQPVRGIKFWKIDPNQAMEPPEIVKIVGRPKVKRNREPNEARKQKGEWSYSRKGTVMTCNKCGGENHNSRTCFKVKQTYNGWTLNLITDSGESIISSKKNQKDSTISTLSSKDDWLDFEFENETQTQQSDYSSQVTTQQSQAYGPDIGDEEDPPLRPQIISESQSVLKEIRLKARLPTGTRRSQFTGGADGVSMPTNLPYSPTKATWKGKAALTLSQLQDEARKKKKKMAPSFG
ncbi:uncharacterized protein [Nicotiana tomentosiformis]|uniref:uncharacterized protein n=1 Tax=Nicotiana tomentosiformis TaxID=4098 RepID=UPI00051B956A|nr:uncharacterized protein LOC104086538 [Nicotiana tomentosiformis]